jgi:GNAT superfamily N-acetyltransferase
MATITSRLYEGASDLRRMQESVAQGFDRTSVRVGDLAWLARRHTHHELSLEIRLWEADGELCAWSFVRSNGEFNLFLAAGRADPALVDEMLAVAEGVVEASVAAGDPPIDLHTYGIDPARSDEDRAIADGLLRRGFEPDPAGGGFLRRGLDALPKIWLPDGYRSTWVRDDADMVGRVEAQRAAFAPSTLTIEQYRRVRRTWPYRPELDRIIVAPDGAVVAVCTAWLDERNGMGLLEPVGTHPSHRRRGLASAVCTEALRVLRDAGAVAAEVGYQTDAALAVYRGIGFGPGPSDIAFRKPT